MIEYFKELFNKPQYLWSVWDDLSVFGLVLSKRLLKMIEANKQEMILYKKVLNKLPASRYDSNSSTLFWNSYNELSKEEKRAYDDNGIRYSKSDIQRVRIELNKSMIEWAYYFRDIDGSLGKENAESLRDREYIDCKVVKVEIKEIEE